MTPEQIMKLLPKKAGLGQDIASHLSICRHSVGHAPEWAPEDYSSWGIMLMAKDGKSSIMAEFYGSDDDVVFMIEQMLSVKDYMSDPDRGT